MNISTLSREGIIQKYLKLEKELNKIKKEKEALGISNVEVSSFY